MDSEFTMHSGSKVHTSCLRYWRRKLIKRVMSPVHYSTELRFMVRSEFKLSVDNKVVDYRISVKRKLRKYVSLTELRSFDSQLIKKQNNISVKWQYIH